MLQHWESVSFYDISIRGGKELDTCLYSLPRAGTCWVMLSGCPWGCSHLEGAEWHKVKYLCCCRRVAVLSAVWFSPLIWEQVCNKLSQPCLGNESKVLCLAVAVVVAWLRIVLSSLHSCGQTDQAGFLPKSTWDNHKTIKWAACNRGSGIPSPPIKPLDNIDRAKPEHSDGETPWRPRGIITCLPVCLESLNLCRNTDYI